MFLPLRRLVGGGARHACLSYFIPYRHKGVSSSLASSGEPTQALLEVYANCLLVMDGGDGGDGWWWAMLWVIVVMGGYDRER